jgi:hypothetical protein
MVMCNRLAVLIACLAIPNLLAESVIAQGPAGGQAGSGGGMCANRSAGSLQTEGVMQSIASAQNTGIAAQSNPIISQAYGIRGFGMRRNSSSGSQMQRMQSYQQNYLRQMQAQQLQAQQQEAQAQAALHDRLMKAADARRAMEAKSRKINSAASASPSTSPSASTARANVRATLRGSSSVVAGKSAVASKVMDATKPLNAANRP